jgi:acyl-CoA dehydrogenase
MAVKSGSAASQRPISPSPWPLPIRSAARATAFLIDKDSPGATVTRAIPMLAGLRTYEVVFEECRVHERQVLGRIGQGFAPMQLRLTVRRLQMGAWCIGMAQRALDMMVEHANQRVTFGQKLADR